MRRLERDEHGKITLTGRVQRLEGIVQVLALVFIVGLLTVLLSGCGSPQDRNVPSGITYYIDLPNGGRVLCAEGLNGDLSCDWEGTRSGT
ncbi:hypothetical protein KHO57_gp064 [Mycobacterium phage Phabba]|uniref:Uncharacterized protein n=1 Tax=Mycobacterium phage Phabba TaxID=2027899 RepID=A0A249XSD0_9CAUD|nr:hypothetical protein KHO57_gp064 [Mycobacterium phage Phabba]ASZ74639.1 hypothetical protein SEA_PHABBA_64 [Mycobacterium phage Phabba]